MTTLKQIKETVSADQISRQKDGSIMFRSGYFYHSGRTAEGFRDRIVESLNKAGITHSVVDCGDHWAAFRGGAGVKQNSHFYARIEIIDLIPPVSLKSGYSQVRRMAEDNLLHNFGKKL